jgi:hypothetical protein
MRFSPVLGYPTAPKALTARLVSGRNEPITLDLTEYLLR